MKKIMDRLRPRIFKYKLRGMIYRSYCRAHFDVPFWDAADILSADIPPNTLMNITETFNASNEELGDISFSILNVPRGYSRIYVHCLIPMNSDNNVLNSKFIIRTKENLLKSYGAEVHYLFEKDTYDLTYSVEVTPDQVKQLITKGLSFDSLVNKHVRVRIVEALNSSLY